MKTYIVRVEDNWSNEEPTDVFVTAATPEEALEAYSQTLDEDHDYTQYWVWEVPVSSESGVHEWPQSVLNGRF